MNILYEGVTRSDFLIMISIIVTVAVATVGLIWIFLSLTDGEWTRDCTIWLVVICISILVTVFRYDRTPEHRYIRVDISSITDWDTIIEKYNTGNITGKVLELTEKEPLE